MAKIAVVPMAAKPYHAGHDALVRLAASENDKVIVYASTGDRDNVSGDKMHDAWLSLIVGTLPANCTVIFTRIPVRAVFETMNEAAAAGSLDTFTVYSDDADAGRFSDKNVEKYAPGLRVQRRSVNRESFVNVSGTKMREMLARGDKATFIANVPSGIDGERYWEILTA